MELTESDKKAVCEVLSRRANEIAGFYEDQRSAKTLLGSVELALQREIKRLRSIADKLAPPPEPEHE